MTTVMDAPSKAHPARQKALEGFLAKLREWNGSAAAPQNLDRAANVTIGQRKVTLEPWERQQLRDWFMAGEDAEVKGRYLLAHGAALMLKTAFDIERIHRDLDDPAANTYALQAELMLDAAIGMAVLKDLQNTIETEVKAGRLEDAKGLTQFRHRLGRVVDEAKRSIAESEREQAASLADTLSESPDVAPTPGRSLTAPVRQSPQVVPPPCPASGAEPSVVEFVGTTPQQVSIAPDGSVATPPRKRRAKKPAAKRLQPAATPADHVPSLTGVLAVLCAVTCACWLAFTQAPKLVDRQPAVMRLADFAASTPIRAVESHAPSVFVTIPASSWSELDDREREALIQELGRSAARLEFTGLMLRDDAGVPVAQWLALRGAALIDATERTDAARPPVSAPAVVIKPVETTDRAD